VKFRRSFLFKPGREGDHQTAKMKVKWTKLGMVFFLLLSFVMTGCFLWQYRIPKATPGKNGPNLKRLYYTVERSSK